MNLTFAKTNDWVQMEKLLENSKGAIMTFLGQLLGKIASHKIVNVFCITVLSVVIAILVNLSRPELLLDVFYGVPIVLALLGFGYWGGWIVATTSVILFYLSNYYLKGVAFGEAWPSTLITYLLFLLFSVGAYFFLLNRRKLNEAQVQLQARLEVQNQLHRQTQVLHQQNLKVAVIDERNRIAREIHDVLAQGLMAIILKVEIAFLEKDISGPLKQRLDEIDELARHHLHEARRSVADLRPLPLEGKSLQEALQLKVNAFQAEYHIEGSFESSGDIKPLPSEVETGLYRIAQEALNNAGQHSGADRVNVSLDYDEDEVCLTVQDNGSGFELKAAADPDPGKTRNSRNYGLSTMQERADMVGGWISIQSSPKGGCRVRVSVPYNVATILKPGRGAASPAAPAEMIGA